MVTKRKKAPRQKRRPAPKTRAIIQFSIEEVSEKLRVARSKVARKKRFWQEDFWAFWMERYRHNKSETTRLTRFGANIERVPTMSAQTMGDLKRHLRSRASVIAKKLDESATLESATDPFELIERWCVDWTAREIADTFVSEQSRALRGLDLELDSLRELIIRSHLEVLRTPPTTETIEIIRRHVSKFHKSLASTIVGRLITTLIRELLVSQAAAMKMLNRSRSQFYGVFENKGMTASRSVFRDAKGWHEYTPEGQRLDIVLRRAPDGRYLSQDSGGELKFCFFGETETRDRVIRVCERFGFERARYFASDFLDLWCASPSNREQAKLLRKFLEEIGETPPSVGTLEKDIATIRRKNFKKPPAHFRI